MGNFPWNHWPLIGERNCGVSLILEQRWPWPWMGQTRMVRTWFCGMAATCNFIPYLHIVLQHAIQHLSLLFPQRWLSRPFPSEMMNFPARFDNCSVRIIAKFWHKTVQILQVCWRGLDEGRWVTIRHNILIDRYWHSRIFGHFANQGIYPDPFPASNLITNKY